MNHLGRYGDYLLDLTPRNIYLGSACELGFLGLVPFLIPTYSLLRSMAVACRKTKAPELKQLIACILGSLAGHLSMGMFHMSHINATFWIMASLDGSAG